MRNASFFMIWSLIPIDLPLMDNPRERFMNALTANLSCDTNENIKEEKSKVLSAQNEERIFTKHQLPSGAENITVVVRNKKEENSISEEACNHASTIRNNNFHKSFPSTSMTNLFDSDRKRSHRFSDPGRFSGFYDKRDLDFEERNCFSARQRFNSAFCNKRNFDNSPAAYSDDTEEYYVQPNADNYCIDIRERKHMYRKSSQPNSRNRGCDIRTVPHYPSNRLSDPGPCTSRQSLKKTPAQNRLERLTSQLRNHKRIKESIDTRPIYSNKKIKLDDASRKRRLEVDSNNYKDKEVESSTPNLNDFSASSSKKSDKNKKSNKEFKDGKEEEKSAINSPSHSVTSTSSSNSNYFTRTVINKEALKRPSEAAQTDTETECVSELKTKKVQFEENSVNKTKREFFKFEKKRNPFRRNTSFENAKNKYKGRFETGNKEASLQFQEERNKANDSTEGIKQVNSGRSPLSCFFDSKKQFNEEPVRSKIVSDLPVDNKLPEQKTVVISDKQATSILLHSVVNALSSRKSKKISANKVQEPMKDRLKSVNSSVSSDTGEVFLPEESAHMWQKRTRQDSASLDDSMEWESVPFELIQSEIKEVRKNGTLSCDRVKDFQGSSLDLNEVPDQSNIFIIVDTNVLLSSLSLIQKLMKTTIQGRDLILVLAWQVLSELDNLKSSSKHISTRARAASSFLSEQMSRKHPRIRAQPPDMHKNSVTEFKPDVPDDYIILTCLQLKQNKHCIVLLTNDKNLMAKSEAAGIPTFSEISIQKVVNHNSYKTVLVDLEEPPSSHENSVECAVAHKLTKALMNFLSKCIEEKLKEVHGPIWFFYVLKPPPWSLLETIQCTRAAWDIISTNTDDHYKQFSLLNALEFFFKDNKYSSFDARKLNTLFDDCCTFAGLMPLTKLAVNFISKANEIVNDSLKVDDGTVLSPTLSDSDVIDDLSINEESVSNVIDQFDVFNDKVNAFGGFIHTLLQIPWPLSGPEPGSEISLPAEEAKEYLQYTITILETIIEGLNRIKAIGRGKVRQDSQGLKEVHEALTEYIFNNSITAVDVVHFSNSSLVRNHMESALSELNNKLEILRNVWSMC